jgi:ABC-type transport system involved in cytochrome c biogenesis permease subunit
MTDRVNSDAVMPTHALGLVSFAAITFVATTFIVFSLRWLPRPSFPVLNFWSVLISVVGISFLVFFRFLRRYSSASAHVPVRVLLAAGLAVGNYLAAINAAFALAVFIFGE